MMRTTLFRKVSVQPQGGGRDVSLKPSVADSMYIQLVGVSVKAYREGNINYFKMEKKKGWLNLDFFLVFFDLDHYKH